MTTPANTITATGIVKYAAIDRSIRKPYKKVEMIVFPGSSLVC